MAIFPITGIRPRIKIIENQTNMIGPKAKPTILVPNLWKKNNSEIMAKTIPTVKLLPGTKTVSSPFTSFKASIADKSNFIDK